MKSKKTNSNEFILQKQEESNLIKFFKFKIYKRLPKINFNLPQIDIGDDEAISLC